MASLKRATVSRFEPVSGYITTMLQQVATSVDIGKACAADGWVKNRDWLPLQMVQSSYSSVWQQYGGGVPFIDIANRYVLSLHREPYTKPLLDSKDWTQIASDIQTDAPLGIQITPLVGRISEMVE